MARIQYTKQNAPILEGLLPTALAFILDFSGYGLDDGEILVPDADLPLEVALNLDRKGFDIYAYSIFFEIPDTDLSEQIPEGVSFRSYEDDSEPPQTIIRTWNDLGVNTTGNALTIRYWQSSNNSQFMGEDVVLIQEAGYTVYGAAERSLRVQDLTDFPQDPENENPVTIEQIADQWAYNFYDFVHAHNEMKAIYENKIWENCTTKEKRILVEWNQVGLNKANELVPPSWSEGRTAKELGKAYRTFNINIRSALARRFDDWYHFVRLFLSGAGQTKFEADWSWDLKEQYLENFLRQNELGAVNKLVEFNTDTLGNYTESDWVGTIPAATIVNNLNKVLTANEPPI